MLKSFFGYTEIMTKITSVFAFLYTIAFLIYQEQDIKWEVTLLFFASMFLFDLTTTAINNYIDTKTNDQNLHFNRKTALEIIYVLFIISAVLGLYLAYLTGIVVLLAGAFCFVCGVFYTYGPVPISRQPWGELLSGIFYGFFIPFLILYINQPAGTYLMLIISWHKISLDLMIVPLLKLVLFSILPICTTANIMLANNICDLEKDILVKRYTLPYYIGHRALYLFAGLYYITYPTVIIMIILKMLSPWCLLSLLTIIPVQKNISIFFAKQEKATTFLCSIRNYIIIMGTNTAVILISAFVA